MDVMKAAIPALKTSLKDEDAVRSRAVGAFIGFEQKLFDTKSTEMLPQMREMYKALKELDDAAAVDVKRTIDYLESLWWVALRERSMQWVLRHPYLSSGVAIYPLLLLTWLLLLWIHPYWLLPISTLLSRFEVKIKTLIAELNLPVRYLLLIAFFHYHRRVLDAWVRKYLPTANTFANYEKLKEG